MKASELRIGNYILDNDDNVNEVDSDLIHYIDCCDNNESGFEPIPLTEEWLVKFGVLEGFGIGLYHININDINILMIDLKGGFADIGDEVTLKYNIKYVHQLQNLYFALTGEELTIK